MIQPRYLYLLCALTGLQCTSPAKEAAPGFYTAEDYAKVRKIDAHVHILTADTSFFAHAREDNFLLLNINVDAPSVRPIEEQREITFRHRQQYPTEMEYATTFGVKNFNDADWETQTLASLQRSFSEGAIAVKIWKNVGMDLRDKNSQLVYIDNPRFDTIISFIRKNDIPLIGHFGEPKNCWQPLDSMTVNDYKHYYRANPQFHMYLHPGITTYEEQVQHRDAMLDKFPDLRFVGAHLGSLEWSLDELAGHLERYPHMAVDMAERISHFQLESQKDYDRTRDFVIRYADRLIYATDIIVWDGDKPEDVRKTSRDKWFTHWLFFTTDSTITSESVNGPFKGLKLPREVVDKIYYSNAKKWFPKGFQQQ
jgi:Predicted metal-dependent hydrolase of the TIM-barrel fold